jgi:hypothetical protein
MIEVDEGRSNLEMDTVLVGEVNVCLDWDLEFLQKKNLLDLIISKKPDAMCSSF